MPQAPSFNGYPRVCRHAYKLTRGTLYPLLHELEKEGVLRSHAHIVRGKKRKYYEITPQGSKIIEEVKPKIKGLINEVLE